MKVFEYLYSQKPVISTNIRSLNKLSDFVYLSNSYKDWIDAINNKDTWYNPKKISSRKLATANSWKKKIKQIKTLATS